jgi:hypothetical protein
MGSVADEDGGSSHGAFDEDAFFDPDAPFTRKEPPRAPADYARVVLRPTLADLSDVVVTGIGDDPHLDDDDSMARTHLADVHVAHLARAVEGLAEALRARGEAGLRTTRDMSPFEATLRAYCVGYLAGARGLERG